MKAGLLGLMAEREADKAVPQLQLVTPVKNTPVAATNGREITVQYFSGLYDTKGSRTVTGTVNEVLAELGKMHPLPVVPNDAPKFHKTKAQAAMFNVAVYGDSAPTGANRADNTWQVGYWAIVGDADDMTPDELDAFEAKLDRKGWLHLKTTSFKHTEMAPRCRYVVPVARDLTHDQYRTGWVGLNAMAGGKLDPGAKDPTRRSYVPSCPQGEEANRPPAVIRGSRLATVAELTANSTATAPEIHTDPRTGYSADDLSINADIAPKYDSTPADFELVRQNCPNVRDAVSPENQPSIEEPHWRGILGITKFCTEPDKHAQEVSRHHLEYDPAKTSRKLAQWGAGPTTCKELGEHNAKACAGCRHNGLITSPIQLGRPDQSAAKTGVVDQCPLEVEGRVDPFNLHLQ